MKVKSAMHRDVEWCSPDMSIADIAKIMKREDVGAIPIGENDRLIGMVTDRDIVCKAVANGADLGTCKASDVMTHGIVVCREDENVANAVHRMELKKIRRLPVINASKRMVGMLSLGDISAATPFEMSGEALRAVSAHH